MNDKQKVEAFREKRMEDLNKLENFLKKNKISYRRFDTKEDTFKKLYLFFK
ncbi:MAG: hypothetical protein LBC61_06505 [Candidatus Peribacteria bacterium]|nr:hypothetical protein [Candidatus Peribacteria bacterium]